MLEPGETFATDIPARLDRLPFSRFHWLAMAACGGALLLAGAGALLALEPSGGLLRDGRLSAWSPGAFGLGAAAGALTFGRVADLRGRRAPLQIALALCLVASLLNALAWNLPSLALMRLILGPAVGGQACVASAALMELVPARRRGYATIALGGAFWLGAALVALAPASGWRFAFVGLACAAAAALALSRRLPESPRWMMATGQVAQAETLVFDIERGIERHRALPALFAPLPKVRLTPRQPLGWRAALVILVQRNRRRAALVVAFVLATAFACDAIFLSYGPMLTRCCEVPASGLGRFLPVFAFAGLAGPLLLGRPFDGLGRKPMTVGVFTVAGMAVCLTGWLFGRSGVTAPVLVLAWGASLLFLSVAAAAVLMLSEGAPTELRATAVSLLVVLALAVGGVLGPGLFSAFLGGAEPAQVFSCYTIAGALMLAAAAAELLLGVRTERRPLEDVARPLAWASPDPALRPNETGRPQAEPARAMLNG